MKVTTGKVSLVSGVMVKSLMPKFPQREDDITFQKKMEASFLLSVRDKLFKMLSTSGLQSVTYVIGDDAETSSATALLELYGLRYDYRNGLGIVVTMDYRSIVVEWMWCGIKIKPDVHFIPLDGGTASKLACLREVQEQKRYDADMKPYESEMDKVLGPKRRADREAEDKKIKLMP